MTDQHLCVSGVMPRVRVLPVVYFSILEHYARRTEGQQRVIGTLLGTVTGSTVEVTTCFPVPHSETEQQVAVDMDYHNTMYDLHRKINSNEVIVGWYATGAEVTEHSVLIHDFFTREAVINPVHLLVDATLKKNKLKISALVSNAMGVPDGKMGCLFVPVQCSLIRDTTERIARMSHNDVARVEFLSSTLTQPQRSAPLSTDLEHVTKGIDNLQGLLTDVVAYVEKVMAGQVPADPEVGQFLVDTVAAIPKIDPVQFENLFQNTLQDLLMVTYLANLTRTQVAIQAQLDSIL